MSLIWYCFIIAPANTEADSNNKRYIIIIILQYYSTLNSPACSTKGQPELYTSKKACYPSLENAWAPLVWYPKLRNVCFQRLLIKLCRTFTSWQNCFSFQYNLSTKRSEAQAIVKGVRIHGTKKKAALFYTSSSTIMKTLTSLLYEKGKINYNKLFKWLTDCNGRCLWRPFPPPPDTQTANLCWWV